MILITLALPISTILLMGSSCYSAFDWATMTFMSLLVCIHVQSSKDTFRERTKPIESTTTTSAEYIFQEPITLPLLGLNKL